MKQLYPKFILFGLRRMGWIKGREKTSPSPNSSTYGGVETVNLNDIHLRYEHQRSYSIEDQTDARSVTAYRYSKNLPRQVFCMMMKMSNKGNCSYGDDYRKDS